MPEADWFGFCPAQPPDFSVVEMDVVEGAGGKGGNVFLTLLFRSCLLMLVFLPTAGNTSEKFSISFMTGWEPHPMDSCSL